MEVKASATLMVMYEDESVDVRYGNGCQLQLSPCGCEFILVNPADPSRHPLQTTERIRQRTRFTISTYKDMIMAALAFRNKYASRPYLPEELIPADHKKPFFSIDSHVQWAEWSSSNAEFRPSGETIVTSEEGRAALMLSPSGEEFSVEFTCNLSSSQNQLQGMEAFSKDPGGSPGGQQHASSQICQSSNKETNEAHRGSRQRRNESRRSRSSSPQITCSSQPKPERMYQSTTVVQHHSCSAVSPIWHYPLSVARHLWTTHLSKPENVRAEQDTGKDTAQAHRRANVSDTSAAERQSHLPHALPLTCPSPHRHRWKIMDPLAKDEHSHQDLLTELVKVMWCHGVTYRILSGSVPVVEVSPGDGSVIRSNGVLSTYFTHHKPELLSGQMKEVKYHLNNLPPDLPGQLYSVCSVVSRASRILTCYNNTKQSLKLPATPSCLKEVREGGSCCKSAETEENLPRPVSVEQHVNVTQTEESRSNLVAAELEKIKRFRFLLDNTPLLGSEKQKSTVVECDSEDEVTHEAVNEDCIAETLRRTSKAIHDIDALISATALT